MSSQNSCLLSKFLVNFFTRFCLLSQELYPFIFPLDAFLFQKLRLHKKRTSWCTIRHTVKHANTKCRGKWFYFVINVIYYIHETWGLQHVIKSREWKLLRFKHQFVIPGKHQFTITMFNCNYGHKNALDCPHLCCRLGALYLTLARFYFLHH